MREDTYNYYTTEH